MMRLPAILTSVLLALCTACGSSTRGSSGTAATPSGGQALLSTIADVPLPGDTSRWDYQSIDPQSHRLFIAHLGAGEVVVYDTQQAAVVGTIRGVAGVHGVIAIPELRRV